MIPEPVLIEELEARHVEQRVEGRPEIAIVTRVLLDRAVEHVVRHPPAHFVFVGIAQVLRGVERVDEHVERVIKPGVLPARWANKQDLCQSKGVSEDEGHLREKKRGGANIRKEFLVYIAVGVQVGIVTCVAEKDDQENIVEVRVLSAFAIGGVRRRKAQRPALTGGSC